LLLSFEALFRQKHGLKGGEIGLSIQGREFIPRAMKTVHDNLNERRASHRKATQNAPFQAEILRGTCDSEPRSRLGNYQSVVMLIGASQGTREGPPRGKLGLEESLYPGK
jgi:hypothetical protein